MEFCGQTGTNKVTTGRRRRGNPRRRCHQPSSQPQSVRQNGIIFSRKQVNPDTPPWHDRAMEHRSTRKARENKHIKPLLNFQSSASSLRSFAHFLLGEVAESRVASWPKRCGTLILMKKAINFHHKPIFTEATKRLYIEDSAPCFSVSFGSLVSMKVVILGIICATLNEDIYFAPPPRAAAFSIDTTVSFRWLKFSQELPHVCQEIEWQLRNRTRRENIKQLNKNVCFYMS